MVDQPQGRTRYDDLVEKIDEMIVDRGDEAIAPLLRQFEALERRVTELEEPVRRVTLSEPDPRPSHPARDGSGADERWPGGTR